MNSELDDKTMGECADCGAWVPVESQFCPKCGKRFRIRNPMETTGLTVVPADAPVDVWKQATQFQLVYSLAGLVLGLVCIVGGIILFLNGVTGSTSWTAKILGAESNLSDAAPGAVLFVVGLFVVFVTRYAVKAKGK